MKLNVQPFIITVGRSSYKLDKFYIQVDSISYEIPSFFEAIFILFKIYLTANIAYPFESENVCYFIQWGLMKIKTNSDVHIPSVYTALNRLKKV